MKKFLTILSISAALAACDVKPSASLRMQASDLASPHVHHGTESDFVISDYMRGELELPKGLSFNGEVFTGTLENELNVAHITAHRSGMDIPLFRGAKRAITLSIPGFEGEG